MLQRRVYASHRRMRQIKCPLPGIGSKAREELWTQHFSQITDALVGEEMVIRLPIELLGHVAPRVQGLQHHHQRQMQHFSQIIDALVGEEVVIPLPIELLGHVAPRAQGLQHHH